MGDINGNAGDYRIAQLEHTLAPNAAAMKVAEADLADANGDMEAAFQAGIRGADHG